ncbi:hypothetical protein HOY82DRAFT_595801 [Tuber indicum]|nr:hypothetical protein HOY82DRAFT_595801 [Tuber indicum]
MSATSILASLTTSQDAVLMRLKEAADVLCKDHIHFMAPLAINQGEIVDLYTMTIDCGEDDIVWAVEMWPNCRLKSIKRCKKVSIPNVNPARPSLPLIQPRYVWAEGICNEILKLIRMAHPGENWWANDSVFQSDQPNDL